MPPSSTPAFPSLLKSWRHLRRFSQLHLALSAGVSQRHLSFLESGRAQPSRAMILLLCDALDVPLRQRNDLLTAAGFAPVFQNLPLDHPQMAQVQAAVQAMLSNHAPFPAVAVDRAWNLRLANAPFEQLLRFLGPNPWTPLGGSHRNLLRLFFHPAGIRPLVANWSALAPLLWRRARREAQACPELQQLIDELLPLQDQHTLHSAENTPLFPVLPLVLQTPSARLSLFSVISTFGTAQDITADELRIESFFPADPPTERLFHSL